MSTTIDNTVLARLQVDGLLREGHFAYRSGRHSNGLLDRDLLLTDPSVASRFGYDIAKHFFTDRIDTIATPSIWGAGLAQWVGYFMEPKARVIDATPRGEGAFVIAPKVEPLVSGRRVLLVDNLILTGETMEKFAQMIEQLGGTVHGVATLWSAGKPELGGHPVYSVLNDSYAAWPETECPLCRAATLPVETVDY